MSAYAPKEPPKVPPPSRPATGEPTINADSHPQLRRLQITSIVEGTTLVVLLFIAVPLKHVGGWTPGVQLMGPLHGLAFLAYVWLTIQTASAENLPRAEVLKLLVLALVPFGGFINSATLSRKRAALALRKAS